MSKKMAIALILTAALLAGCSAAPQAEPREITPLRVMYYSEDAFYYEYGMLFAALYPEVQLEVVSTNGVKPEEDETINEAMMKFIAEKKPDVLMLNAGQYKQLAAEGRLLDLEARAAKDKFDLDGIVPGILEYIRGLSDGKLYGMAPSFYGRAVYYNKDLFQRYGVSLPEDRMSWESLLQLASRFPAEGEPDKRVYGLKPDYRSDLASLARQIGGSLGLSYFNASDMRMTANSASWIQVVEMADKAIKDGYLYTGEEMNDAIFSSYEDYLLQDAFIGGKAAMTIDGSYLISQIKEAQTVLKDKALQNWDIVTIPVDPKNPNVTDTAMADPILAIDAQSPNVEAAWRFLQYVNGDEFARVTSKKNSGSFPVRTKYIADDEGHNLQAFYALTPIEETVYKDYDKLPNETFTQMMDLIAAELSEAGKEKQTISEAMDRIQDKGQLLLDGKGERPKETPDESGSGLMISPRAK